MNQFFTNMNGQFGGMKMNMLQEKNKQMEKGIQEKATSMRTPIVVTIVGLHGLKTV